MIQPPAAAAAAAKAARAAAYDRESRIFAAGMFAALGISAILRWLSHLPLWRRLVRRFVWWAPEPEAGGSRGGGGGYAAAANGFGNGNGSSGSGGHHHHLNGSGGGAPRSRRRWRACCRTWGSRLTATPSGPRRWRPRIRSGRQRERKQQQQQLFFFFFFFFFVVVVVVVFLLLLHLSSKPKLHRARPLRGERRGGRVGQHVLAQGLARLPARARALAGRICCSRCSTGSSPTARSRASCQRLRILEFTLDHEAPSFAAMRRRTSRKDSDLNGVVDVRYTGGARMLLLIEVGGGRGKMFRGWRARVPVLVSDLDLECKMWMKLRLAPMPPYVGTLSLAFVGQPDIKVQLLPYNRVR